MKSIFTLFILLLIIMSMGNLHGQNFDKIIKAVSTDRASSDYLGYSVSVSGNYAVVGAYQEDNDTSGSSYISNTGSAYIFERNTSGNWVQKKKVVAFDRTSSDYFGQSVSISGSVIAIGAYQNDYDSLGINAVGNAGSVYIYTRDASGNWNFTQKIIANQRVSGDNFGYSVSVSSNYIIVGAYNHDYDSNNMNYLSKSGAAYIFAKNTSGHWFQEQKLVSSDRNTSDQFGYSVAVSGSYAIVGANYEDEDASGANFSNAAGSAYIFERSTQGNWIQAQKVVASDRNYGDYFGTSVSISGSYAVVGAYQEDEDELGTNTLSSAGSAYVFERNLQGLWSQKAKLVASDRASNDYFGLSVNISGDEIIIGAPYNTEGFGFSNAGSAYIYERNTSGTWSFLKKLVANDKNAYDFFGYSVSISGDYAFCGAYQEDEDDSGANTLSDAGSFYIFEPLLFVTNTISVSSCESYTSPSNTYIWNSSGTYHDTLTSSSGLDSILTINLTIYNNPNINISSLTPQCSDNNSIPLSATPSGGSFSGTGVTGNTFSPSTAGVGTHQITYSYTDGNGCSASDSVVVQVNAPVNVNFNASMDSIACKIGDAVVLHASPAGGVFSGNAVSDTLFDPAYASIGFNTVYYNYTDANSCTATDSIFIKVVANPVATFSSALNSDYCMNADSILMQATPSGGVFGGTGVSNNYFYPSNAQQGYNSMYYFYTDSNGCEASYSYIYMNILPTPTAQILNSLDSAYCSNEASFNLVGYPVGGVFSGNGISGNTFAPALASSGSNTINYHFTNTYGCSSEDSVELQIMSLPIVNITSSLNASYCIQDANVNLSATPMGGLFKINGQTQTLFNPNALGTGNQLVIYNYTDANGCSNSDTINTIVYMNPNVTILSNLNSSYCADASSITLTASPSGGNFSGAGVTGNSFNPSTAGTGSHTITYSYTDGNGCSNMDSVSTIINSLPTVSLTSPADVCEDAGVTNLTGGSPSGGSYSGTGVFGSGYFYPNIAGVGNHQLTYNFTDANGCSDTVLSSIKVKSLPTSSFSVAATACLNSNVNVNFTGTASAAAAYTWNFDNATIASGSGVGPYGLSWNAAGIKQLTLLVTDSGCTSATTSNYVNILSTYAQITAVGNTEVCYGDSVTLFANMGPNYGYQWYDTAGVLVNDTLSYYVAGQAGTYFCEVTPPNGCSAFSDSITIVIKPQLIADFSLPNTACNGEMVNINFTGTAPVGASYNWSFGNGAIASGSSSGPYNIIWTNDSTHKVSLMVAEGGCSSEIKEKNITILSTQAHITPLGSTSFCNGGQLSLSANAGNFSYHWYKDGLILGDTLAITTVNQSGQYQVEVTDKNSSCQDLSDSLEIIVNTTDFNLAFTANPTNFTLPPFNTQITNQTPNSNDYYWLWSFGDGSNSTLISPSHQYGYDGTYTIGIVAQNINTGCYDTLIKTNYISCAGGSANPCTLDATIGSNGLYQICPGDSLRLYSKEHTVGVTYQWLKDGVLISGQSDSVFFATQTGNYQVMVADTACSVFSQPYPLTLRTTITPVILANGIIQPCSNDSMELYVSTAFSSYQWSNGATTPNIFVNTSNSYLVTGTDANGCTTTSSPYVVNASFLQAPEICIVGVDSATNHNKIIWQRNNSAQIDSFKIYRESTTAGIYDLIGSQPFAITGIFEDATSNTAVQSYRYRITAVDSCGMETAPSAFHRTIHLTINAGLNNSWNLIWNNYEGFSFGSYRIYRGSDSTNLQLLTQIQSTLNSYTDLNPPAGNVYYQIEVVSPHPCYPDSIYSKAKTNYNTSRSNRTNTNTAPNIGFEQSADESLSLLLYPNPNKGQFTLELNSATSQMQTYQLEVYSVMGELIHSEAVSFGNKLSKTMRFEHLSKGVYFVRLRSKDHLLRSRFVVE